VPIKNIFNLVQSSIIKPILTQLQNHRDRALEIPWKFAQVGFLLLAFLPTWGVICIAIALLGTWKQKFHKIIHNPINKGFGILSILLIITAFFAVLPGDAFLGLANLLPFFALFAAFSELIQTPQQLRQMSWLFVMSSVPVFLVGLGQQFFSWQGPEILHSFLGWGLELHGNPPGRMSAVFMHANLLAFYTTIVFILALGLFIETYQEGRGKKEEGRRKKEEVIRKKEEGRRKKEEGHFPITDYPFPLLFLSLVIVGNGVALIFTNSRNAWGLAIFACLAFALYLGLKKFLAIVTTITGVILWSSFGPNPVKSWLQKIIPAFFWARLNDEMYPDRPWGTLRTTQWQFTLNMIQQRPFTGWGLRNFSPLYEVVTHEKLQHPHNLFLMLTAETGIITMLLLSGLIGVIMTQAFLFLIQNYRKSQHNLMFFSYTIAFTACIIFNTMDVTLFDLRSNTLGWLLLSAIAGIIFSRNSQGRNPVSIAEE
jgi:O-antigen ligase